MHSTWLRVAAGVATVSLPLVGCGNNEPETAPAVTEGWNDCLATDVGQEVAYAGIRPEGANLPPLEDVTVTENPSNNSITFTGTVEGVSFRCVYNTFAKVSAFDWGS